MREPIREPIPEGRGPRGPEPFRAPGTGMLPEVTTPFTLSSLVEWAPIWGGMFVSLGILLMMGLLGVAIGVGSGAAVAGVWGAISVIIAFFAGGWFTGRTMTMIESLVAGAHGLLMWAVTIVFTLVFAVAATISSVAATTSLVRVVLGPIGLTAAAPTVSPGAAVTTSWVTFLVLLLGAIAAIVGALVGNQGRFSEVRH
ncbi:MAG TPA: hypothetical protein VFZ25_16060 [Chloroflexota bacterium]|nr:hypothetical protein [Chloroflexota bacterium]